MRTILALVLGLLAACGTEPSEPDVESYENWSRALMESAERGDESSAEVSAGFWKALPLDRIRLERSMSYLTFERVEIVFELGGAATRSGGMRDWPSQDVASYTASVPWHDYAKLCWLQEKLDLPDSSRAWASPVSHGEHLRIECTTAKGETLEFSDYANACPPEVTAFAAAIELAARRLEWTPVP